MKIQDLRKKSPEELGDLLKENRDKIRELRFKLASRQLKDMRALRKIKRQIAKILTIKNQPKSIEDK